MVVALAKVDCREKVIDLMTLSHVFYNLPHQGKATSAIVRPESASISKELDSLIC